jgi:outer membrane protein TolC
MKNKWIIIFLCLLGSMQVQGQDKKTLDLSTAVQLSLKNSHQLEISQAKIEEATAALKEAMNKKLPDVGASASYLRLNSANFDLKTKSSNPGSGTPAEQPKVSQAMYGILNASLPVYSGGRIRYGIESSALLEKAARLDAEKDKDEIIQTTIEAFAALYKASSAVTLVRENLLQSQAREKELASLEKNGMLARNDLLKAQLQTSNIELNLLDAENNLQLANLSMNLMLGLPADMQLELDTSGISRKEDTRTLDDFTRLAANERNDVAALDYRKKAAESTVKAIAAEKLPSIQLTGGYIAADIPKVLSVTNAFNLGVGISYNLSSLWKNKAKVQQAEARVKQFVATEAMLNDEIRKEVNKNYFSLVSNRKKIDVTAKALEQAKENYRIVKNKFNNNLATTTELLEADVAELQASMAYTLSRADAFVAYHKLLKATGLLSKEFGK